MYNVKFENINNSEILNDEQKLAFDKIASIFQTKNITEVRLQKSIFGKDRVHVTIKTGKPIMTDGALTLDGHTFLILSQVSVLNRIRFSTNQIELSL